MRADLWTVPVCLLLIPAVAASCHAAGRTPNPPNPLAQSFAFNAWCRDGVIQIAVCNLGDAPQQVKAAVGCYDTTKHLFGSQSFAAEPKTINVVEFPVMNRPSPRGDIQQSDSAFVFADPDGANVEVGCLPVQRVYPRPWDASMDDYVVEAGRKATMTYKEKASDALRMVFVAKTAPPDCSIEPVQKNGGNVQALTTESLKELGLPPEVVRTYSDLLRDHLGFMIQKGSSGKTRLSCATGAVNGCKAVTVPIERHVVDPAGGTAGGMGPTILVYDPKTITLKPALHLPTTEESAGLASKEAGNGTSLRQASPSGAARAGSREKH